MLNTVTAALDEAATALRSLVDRDEFGAITGRTGLFTAPVVPISLAGCDDHGRPLDRWAPDGDLL
jgi:hypothetical protein